MTGGPVHVGAEGMLNVWGSAFVSGVVTILSEFGDVPPDVSVPLARVRLESMMSDPAIRETILESIRRVAEGTSSEGIFSTLPYGVPRPDGRSGS